jgi:hypothetical protein
MKRRNTGQQGRVAVGFSRSLAPSQQGCGPGKLAPNTRASPLVITLALSLPGGKKKRYTTGSGYLKQPDKHLVVFIKKNDEMWQIMFASSKTSFATVRDEYEKVIQSLCVE